MSGDTVFYLVCLESGEVTYTSDPYSITDGEGNPLRAVRHDARVGTLRAANGQDVYYYFDRYHVTLTVTDGGYAVQAIAGDPNNGIIIEESNDIDGMVEALDIVSAITRRYEGMI